MKPKSILIIYSADYNSLAIGKSLLSQLLTELTVDGDYVATHSKGTRADFITLNNGTKIYSMPVGSDIKGMRVTDLYVEGAVANLENGNKYIEEVLTPCVLLNNKFSELDTEGSKWSRIKKFELSNNTIEIKNYKEETL